MDTDAHALAFNPTKQVEMTNIEGIFQQPVKKNLICLI